MVLVKFLKTKAYGFEQMEVINHADADDSDLCNGVSVLAWTVAGTIKQYMTEDQIEKFWLEDGHFKVAVVPDCSTTLEIIFNMALIGFTQLEKAHPGKISVEVLEL